MSDIDLFFKFLDHCTKEGIVDAKDMQLLCGFANSALRYEADDSVIPYLETDQSINIMLTRDRVWFAIMDVDEVIATSSAYSLSQENPDHLSLDTLLEWAKQNCGVKFD